MRAFEVTSNFTRTSCDPCMRYDTVQIYRISDGL